MFLDFIPVLENSIRNKTVRLPTSLSCSISVFPFICCFVTVDENVSCKSECSLGSQHDLTDSMIIIGRKIEAGVVHFTHVHIWLD